ncbi:MAG: hypothetical protein E7360_06885 [Clostridiales bacterium]|nr:hypothetical protein [Clostridiales bacterium]
MKIDYTQIFRIGDDGIYFNGGEFRYLDITVDENGFSGEQNFENGEFTVRFYSKTEFTVLFKVNSFGKGENAVKLARAKLGSFLLFLQEKSIIIKKNQI